jgi:hypothetical protein
MTSQSAQINSPSKRFGLLAAALHLFAAVLFLICFFRQVSGHDRQVAVSGDAHGYVVTAYNLRTSGMFSHECQDFSGPCPEGKLVPTNYREPLYPMFLALALTLYPEELNRQEFMPAPNQMNPDLHAYLRKWTIGVTLLIAVLSFGTTFLICGSWIASYAVLFLVGTSAGLTENVEIFLSENLAGLLLIASVFFALLAIKRSRIAWLIPSGIAFGLLALTKGVYFYGHLALVAVTILFLVFSKFDRRKVATGLVVFSLFYGLCVGSWKLRNYLTFGSSSVASRGGIMLTIRVYYNMADSEEWKAMFWYATPLRKRFKQSEELLQRVIRLDRTNREGFYLGAKAYAANLSNQIGPTEAEKVLTREAFEKILADPLQHLWVSIPLAFNSLFTES